MTLSGPTLSGRSLRANKTNREEEWDYGGTNQADPDHAVQPACHLGGIGGRHIRPGDVYPNDGNISDDVKRRESIIPTRLIR
jgi:hypothetical protein